MAKIANESSENMHYDGLNLDPYNAEIFMFKPWRQRVFQFEIILNVLFFSCLFEYLCLYESTVIINR